MEYKHFNIIIPSYNNAKWYEQNILSTIGQDYPVENYNITYINDASTDGTGDLVGNLIAKHGWKNIKLINNEKNVGALCNIYNTVHSIEDPKSITFCVDGDDFCANSSVLTKLNNVYQDPNIWMTYGSYLDYPGMTRGCCRPYEDSIIKSRSYRKSEWRASHLRSWLNGLIRKIRIDDLKFNGEWLDVTWDLALQYPTLEMSNGKHLFIPDILILYNNLNPISDYKIKQGRQGMIDAFIRSKSCYPALENLW